MNLEAMQHLIRSAQVLAEGRSFLVLGSASLLASYPELGQPEGPLASTYDADIIPEPFDELTATMLDEALGEDRAYYRLHGYHADILRDSIFETLPTGWRARPIAVPDTFMAYALAPHDLAARFTVRIGGHSKKSSPSDLLVDRRLGHRRSTEETEVAEEIQESRNNPTDGVICFQIHFPSVTSSFSVSSAVEECLRYQTISQTHGELQKMHHSTIMD